MTVTRLHEKIAAARRLLHGAAGEAGANVSDERWSEWKLAYRRRRNTVYHTLSTVLDRMGRRP